MDVKEECRKKVREWQERRKGGEVYPVVRERSEESVCVLGDGRILRRDNNSPKRSQN